MMEMGLVSGRKPAPGSSLDGRANQCGFARSQPLKAALIQLAQTVIPITACPFCKAQNNAGFEEYSQGFEIGPRAGKGSNRQAIEDVLERGIPEQMRQRLKGLGSSSFRRSGLDSVRVWNTICTCQ
jgi:hypothetical protein